MIYCNPLFAVFLWGNPRLKEVWLVTMKKAFWVYIALVLSAIMLSSCSRPPSQPEESVVQIGQPAPKFKLSDLNGKEVSLDQYRGKIVMLDFWATWCGPCRMTMPMLENLEKEYKNSLVLLAINLQDPKDVVSDYAKKQALHSRILLDEQGSIGSLYGTDQIPIQFLIDKNGIVRHIQTGYLEGVTAPELRAAIAKLL
jgi:cytochrome c biogenesis protein CcmG/thiol:disulfide interchange protein DsbE